MEAALHTVPPLFTANTVIVCLPAVMPIEAESEFESVSVYFFVESTQTSIRASVPVTVELAVTSTGGFEVVAPFTGAQMCTPAAVGAMQPDGTEKVKEFKCSVLSMSAENMSP